MNVTEFTSKNISLTGYGAIDKVNLNQEWFNAQQKEYGDISSVYPRGKSVGGNIIGTFCGQGLMGCVIVFKSGVIMAIESDGEYVDWFIVNSKNGKD